MSQIAYIDEVEIKNKRVLLRVDYNVSFNKDGTINDDTRIKNSLPTIEYLLENGNSLILVSHLGNPKGQEDRFSLAPIAERLQRYIPAYKVVFVKDYITASQIVDVVSKDDNMQKNVYFLENTRFYPEEKKNDPGFAKKLASFADVYVNDGFGVCHRKDASVIGIAPLLPSFGGLLLKKEVSIITKAIEAPERPLVVVVAGAKVSTKIGFIEKLLNISDAVLVGGAMANTFLKGQGYEIGCGQYEPEYVLEAKRIMDYAKANNKKLLLPTDYRIGNKEDVETKGILRKFSEMSPNECPLDIGPETEMHYSAVISHAKTIIWNGPLGCFENPQYALGTQTILQAIAENTTAVSIIGGGDTLTSIKHSSVEGKITHISTGGGAMLELIEKGTLPGIEVLKKD